MDKQYYIVKATSGILGAVGTQKRISIDGETIFFEDRKIAEKVLKAIQKANLNNPKVVIWIDWEWDTQKFK